MAVVDIGSNATRMIIGRDDGGVFTRLLFTRVPLALGRDSYGDGNAISPSTQNRLVAALVGLRRIGEAMEVRQFKFVATAAVRDCKNRARLVASLYRRANAKVEVLDGAREAEIIGAFIARQFPAAPAVLNADTGGGSTDCALIKNGIVIARATFAIGTARQFVGGAAEKKKMAEWLRANRGADIVAASSGGGARKLESICGEITAPALTKFLTRVQKMDLSQRARVYDLTPDRARNIVPAAQIAKIVLRALRPATDKLRTIRGGLAEAALVQMLEKRTKKI